MAADRSAPVRMLELGAGIGNDRTAPNRRLLHNSEYFAIDSSAVNIDVAASVLGNGPPRASFMRPVQGRAAVNVLSISLRLGRAQSVYPPPMHSTTWKAKPQT